MRFSDFLLVSDPTDLNFIVGYTDDQNIRINVLDLFTGQIIGSGTAGYVPLFTAANVIDDSVIFQHGSNIVIGGVDSLGYKLAVSGSLYSSNGAVINSTVSGADALRVIGGDGDIFVIPNDLGQSISSLRRIIHPPAILTTESATLGQVNTAISNLEEDIEILLDLKVDKSSVGEPNGVASLDATGKIPLSEIPDSIIGQVQYMGTWNAFTNTPTLNPLVPEERGHYYVVSAAGVFGGVDYAIGDWIISNGVIWEKVDNTDAVTSVFGRIGAILPLEADYQSFYPRLSQAYDNPTWINSLAFTKITGVPPFLLENQTITLSGDVTGSGKTSISSTISNNAVSNEKLRDSVGTSVIGRAANSTGDPADIQASTDGHVLLRSAGNLLFGLISSDSISSINWSKITGTPTTLSGYGITDAYTKTEADNKFVPYTGANANVNLGSNNITANSFIKAGGTSSQFLKADGSVDTSQYVPTTRSVNAGTGLTGGGNLSSDVTISFDTTWGDTRYAYRTRQLTINGTTFDLSADRTWNVGTVTSVGLSMPSAFTVSNSPVTGSGILTVVGAGTTAQYVRGDGSLATFPSLTGYVPYTGATQDLDLGTYGLISDFVRFNPSSSNIPSAEGVMSWDNTDGTVRLSVKGNTYSVPIGQSVISRVRNNTGTNLLRTNYQVVKVAGAQGQRLAVTLAQANNDANSASTLGLVCENISNNQEGFIVNIGQIVNVNTTGNLQGETWLDGDVLYLSPTIAGAITKVKPLAPQHTVILGYVEYAHANNGKIYVKIDNGYELEELHDVSAEPFINNGLLYRDTTLNLWKSATISTILGYTPAPQGNYITSLTGEATASGPGAANVTLLNSAVTGKILTGLNVAGNAILSTDSILTAFGKLQHQVNQLVGGLQYEGTWNASTNTPTITSSVGTDGTFYIVSVAGTTNINGINDWNVGDWIVFHDTSWQKVDNSDSVSSVFGRVGNIVANQSDYSAFYPLIADIKNGVLTVQGTGVLSGSGTFSANQATNNTISLTHSTVLRTDTTSNQTPSFGGSFTVIDSVTSSAEGHITAINTKTITVPSTTASAVQTGLLSNTDWSTFNSKQNALNGTGFVKISGTTISYDNSTYLTTAAAASTYVPYTGATSGVDIGTYTLSASNLIANGGFNAGALLLKQSSNAQTIFLGYTAITPVGNNTLNFGFSTGSGVWKNFTLSSFLLTDNINRTYTLPNASGTIALVGGAGVGTVTSVAALTLGTSGTDLSSTVANSTTTPVITLNVPTASAANRGALSAADWTTFNNKQNALTNPVTGTGTAGQVAYWSSGSAITGEANLFWDATNDRLGIGNANPVYSLDVIASSAADSNIFRAGMSGTSNGFTVQRVSSNFRYTFLDGNVGIGTNGPVSILDLTGSAPILTLNRNGGAFTNTINFNQSGTNYASIISNSGSGEQRYSIGPSVAWGGFHTFYTDTVEQIRITALGALLVGTTNTYSNLATKGDIVLQDKLIFGADQTGNANNRNWSIETNSSQNGSFDIVSSSANNNWPNAAYRLTLTRDGNLGINTTNPNSRLEVFDGDVSVTTSGSFSFFNNNRNTIPNAAGVSLGAYRYRGYSTGTTYQVGSGIWSFSDAAWSAGSTPAYLSFQTTNSGSTSPSEKMVLNSSGNLGLGVTPSAWDGTLVKAIQLADHGASISSFTTGNTSSKFAFVTNNAFYDNAGWKYATNGSVAQYRLANDNHQWYVAPSGTAGNAISFTQAMTLNASGNVQIGTTSTQSGTRLLVAGVTDIWSRANTLLRLNHDGTRSVIESFTDGGYSPISISPNGGNVLIGTTADAGYKLDVNGSFRTGANGMALDSNGFAVTPNASRPWNAFRYSHPQNIVPNGDLESWTSGTSTAPDGFGGYDLGGSTIITRESSIVKEGLYSAKISNPTGTAFSGMIYDGVRVDKTPSSSASSSYTISFWYLTPATNGSVSYIGVFDTASSSYSFIEQLPRAGVWVFYSRTFSIRDDSDWNVTWWVSWGAGTANDTLYVDSVALNKGNQIYNTTRSAVSTTGNVTRWGGFNNLGGNVGIGTTSPYQAKLDVSGVGGTGSVANIAASNSNLDQLLIGSINRGSAPAFFSLPTGSAFLGAIGNGVANTLGIGTFGAAPLIFGTSNTERMRITSGGNVGIGTNSPLTNLHVQAPTVSYGQVRITSTSGSGGEASINYGRTDQGIDSRWTVGQGVASIGDSFGFYTGGASRVNLLTNGNVLIGTTSDAGFKLDVNGSLRSTTNSVISGTFSFINLENNSSKLNCSRFLSIADNGGAVGIGYNSDTIPFGATLLVNGTSYFNGNVGISTTPSGGFRLDVNGTGRFSGELFTSLSNGAIRLRDNGTAQVEVNIRHSSTRNGVLSFTQEAVADRWAIGTRPNDGILYFSANFDLSTPRLTLTSAGAATFSSSVTATAGIFNLNTTDGGFKVVGVNATPTNLAYLANNYFPKFYTRNHNFGITIFDQDSNNVGIQAADLVNGTSAKALIFNPYGGNVGIGTASPVYKFEVSDGTRTGVFNPNSTLDGFFIGTFQSKPLILGTADSERMRITSGGDVGIGTNSPSYLFTVGQAGTTQDSVIQIASTTNGTGSLYFGDTTGTFFTSRMGGFQYSHFNDLMVFITNATEQMRILSNGNLLIGTITDTGDKLRVNGNTFTNTITTYRPGVNTIKSDAWKLGRAALGTQPTETHQITVEIGGVSYVIGAAQL